MNEPDARKALQDKAQSALEDLLKMMGLEGKVECLPEGEEDCLLHIESPDAGRLIGRGAQVLEALQTVINRMIVRGADRHVRFIVDVERYRERKKDRLVQTALEALAEVEQSGHAVKLPPMNASDRRTVHQALKDHKQVQTYSEGPDEHGDKQVVVAPASAQPPPPADSAAPDAGT